MAVLSSCAQLLNCEKMYKKPSRPEKMTSARVLRYNAKFKNRVMAKLKNNKSYCELKRRCQGHGQTPYWYQFAEKWQRAKCKNYKGIALPGIWNKELATLLWERVFFWKIPQFAGGGYIRRREDQCGFCNWSCTTDPIFVLKKILRISVK